MQSANGVHVCILVSEQIFEMGSCRAEPQMQIWEVGSNPHFRHEHTATSEHKAEQRHGIALIGQSDRGAKAAKPQH